MIAFRAATKSDIPAIEDLLRIAQLPTGGISEDTANLFVAAENGTLVGVAGFENCGKNIGLLRSFAVLPKYRSQGIARKLYHQVMTQALQFGISTVYLLTTTAQGYFAKLGFTVIDRSNVPETIMKNTRQFRELCPDSAIIMSQSMK